MAGKKNIRFTDYGNSTSYIDRLDDLQQERFESFLADLRERTSIMTHKAQSKLVGDYVQAANLLLSRGVELDEVLRRLDAKRLGGFYMYPPTEWFPLDNAAKAYPFSMKRDMMQMFRLSCYLKEFVDPELLQVALLITIQRFPSFATTVKKGFFWHYLDSTKRHFEIEQEKYLPCKSINIRRSGSQAFRLVYYHNRISVEFFHVLTDGYGGMVFLRTLVAEYLRLQGHESTRNDQVLDVTDQPNEDEVSNNFAKAELKKGISGFMGKRAVQMSGVMEMIKPYAILHFNMEAGSLKEAAHRYGCTVTCYLLAVMMMAGRRSTEGLKGDFKIQVPINMRKFNGSHTLRNYSMYFDVDMELNEIDTFEHCIRVIKEQLRTRSSQEDMEKMMSTTIKMVSSLRYVPLVLKAPVASTFGGYLGDALFSTVLSNLGVVRMPAEISNHIEKFDFVLGPSPTFRVNCALITYGGTAVLSITKSTKDPTFEETVNELLTRDDVVYDITGSLEDED